MIVRDEARVLERCLDAASPLIDALVICDTGSRDDTRGIASAWIERSGRHGVVLEHRFRDFGASRTRAIRAAEAFLREQGWDLERTYLLFLDADQILGFHSEVPRETLTADVYRVPQRNGGLLYRNVRLVRASLGGLFVGATHEHFVAPPGASQETLTSLEVEDRGDGGARGDKFVRDRRLLERTLRREPGNARAMFYLAETLRNLGEWPRALVWYRRRIAAGGWAEEVWYAHYAIGLMFLAADQIRDAVHWLKLAVHHDSARAEPWFHLSVALRERRHYLLAALCARQGLRLPVPDRALFLEEDVYRWGLLRELALSGYFTRHFRDEGCAANERLALAGDCPGEIALLAVDNLVLYAGPLAVAAQQEIAPELPPPFLPCNPTIAPDGDGYLVSCRAVSYRIDAAQRYLAAEDDGILRTRNVLMRLDGALRVTAQREVRPAAEPARRSRVQGLEDCRLATRPGGFILLGTTSDLHPQCHGMGLLPVDGSLRELAFLPLSGYGEGAAQKNWLPFTDAASGALRAVYGYAPLVVLGIDEASGRCAPMVERPQRRGFAHCRGSAGPVALPPAWGGGWLLLVHQVAFHGRRYYLHRFLHADEDWRLRRASRPFYFQVRGIEFACGACLAQDGKELLVTYGVEDSEAWLCRLPLANVIDSLLPLPEDLASPTRLRAG